MAPTGLLSIARDHELRLQAGDHQLELENPADEKLAARDLDHRAGDVGVGHEKHGGVTHGGRCADPAHGELLAHLLAHPAHVGVRKSAPGAHGGSGCDDKVVEGANSLEGDAHGVLVFHIQRYLLEVSQLAIAPFMSRLRRENSDAWLSSEFIVDTFPFVYVVGTDAVNCDEPDD